MSNRDTKCKNEKSSLAHGHEHRGIAYSSTVYQFLQNVIVGNITPIRSINLNRPIKFL
jgi:hypothetical protein